MSRIDCVITVFAMGLLLATAPANAQDAAKIARGQQVFVAQKCAICHSIAGKGNAKGALDGVGAKLSAGEIHQWIVNPAEMATKTKAARKPPMKAYANLPKEDVDALVAYMQNLKK
jgi:mono/diheme cytochrome c family protein